MRYEAVSTACTYFNATLARVRSTERQTQTKCHRHPNRFIIQTEATRCNQKAEKPIAAVRCRDWLVLDYAVHHA